MSSHQPPVLDRTQLVALCRRHFPDVQAVYLFGSWVANQAHADSDVDIALLLPHDTAKRVGTLSLSDAQLALEKVLRLPVDLINLRLADTVFAFEIIMQAEVLDCADDALRLDFEAITCSLWQTLNRERRDLLKDFEATGIAVAQR